MWIKQEKDCVYEWNKPEGVSEYPSLYGKPHHENHLGYGGYARPTPKPPSLEKAKGKMGGEEMGSRTPIKVGY